MNAHRSFMVLLGSLLITLLLISPPTKTPIASKDTSIMQPLSPQNILWTAPELVFNDISYSSQYPGDIAVDTMGNAYAVWESDLAGTYGHQDIYFSYRPVGGAWGPSVKVNDDINQKPHMGPDIAVDTMGNAYAVWSDNRNRTKPWQYQIYFSYRPSGGSWSTNVAVTSDFLHNSDSDIAVDNAGNAYTIWTLSREGIYFSYRPAGGAWSAPVVVDDASTGDRYSSQIGVDLLGNAYALWTDARSGYRTYFSYRPAGGNWGSNVQVSDPSLTGQEDSALAVDDVGNAYAVWRSANGKCCEILFSYRPAGGSWSSNVRIDDTLNTIPRIVPNIAIDELGNAYAVWKEFRDGDYFVYSSYRLAGGNWGPNIKISNRDSCCSKPAIAVDAAGNAYVLWGESDGNIYFSQSIQAKSIYLPVVFNEPNPISNRPPYTPTNPSPSNGATGQSLSKTLSWTGGDPDGDSVTHDVYFEAGNNPPTVLVCNDITNTSCNPGSLSYNTHYYWQVIATDARGATTTGPVWNFVTVPQTLPPNPGAWYGTTSTGNCIHFDVSSGSSSVYDLVAYIVPSNPNACCQVAIPNGYYEDILSNHFGSSSSCVQGTFTSSTHASGTWKDSYSGSTGTWSADWGSGSCLRCGSLLKTGNSLLPTSSSPACPAPGVFQEVTAVP